MPNLGHEICLKTDGHVIQELIGKRNTCGAEKRRCRRARDAGSTAGSSNSTVDDDDMSEGTTAEVASSNETAANKASGSNKGSLAKRQRGFTSRDSKTDS